MRVSVRLQAVELLCFQKARITSQMEERNWDSFLGNDPRESEMKGRVTMRFAYIDMSLGHQSSSFLGQS